MVARPWEAFLAVGEVARAVQHRVLAMAVKVALQHQHPLPVEVVEFSARVQRRAEAFLERRLPNQSSAQHQQGIQRQGLEIAYLEAKLRPVRVASLEDKPKAREGASLEAKVKVLQEVR